MKIIKRLLAFVVFIFFMTTLSAQEKHTNVISTSFIRLENDLNMPIRKFNIKFITGLEYQKLVNKFLWGFKYEYGTNDEFVGENCFDCRIGTVYTRENNFYLSVQAPLLKSKNHAFILNAGLATYYSNMHYSGRLAGGMTGRELQILNHTIHHLGLAPSLNIQYLSQNQYFLALNSTLRMGLVPMKKYNSNYRELLINAPELRVGIRF